MLSIRSKILGSQALAIATTVICLGVLSYTLMVHALLSVQQHNLEHLAITSADRIHHTLSDLQDRFRNILISRDLQRGSDLPMAKYLAQHQSPFPELSLLDHEGREQLRMIGERIANPNELRDMGHDETFAEAMLRPNEVVMSPVAENTQLGEPTLTFAMAKVRYFGDEFRGLLFGSVPIQQILKKIEKSTFSSGEFLLVIDKNRRILYAPEKQGPFEDLTEASAIVDLALLDAIELAPTGFLEQRVFGEEAYVAYRTDQESQWTFLAVLPSAVFMQPPNQLRNMTILTCVVLLMAGLFVSHYITKRLTRDIDKLTNHTHQIAAGDLSHHVSLTSKDEISALGTAFNKMTDRLAASQETRDRLDSILQSIIDPLLVTDLNGNIKRFNAAAMTLLQCSHDKLGGASLPQIFEKLHSESEESLLSLVYKAPLRDLETEVKSCHGNNIPVLVSCSSLSKESDPNSGLVVILKDISIRKRAEEDKNLALAAAEAARDQVDAILRSVVDGLVVTDSGQRISLMNRSAENLFGVALQDVLYQPIQTLIASEEVTAHLAKQFETPDPAQETEFEVVRHADEPPRIIHARSAAIKSRSGERTGLITTLRDVTEERKIEKIKNEFISTAAHELNTPLATIMGFTEFLIDPASYGGFSKEQQQEFLTEILEKTDVLARIVSDLLDLSRMESGQAMPLQKSLVELDTTIIKATRIYQITDPTHRIDLDLEQSEGTQLLMDQQRIIQVLDNLISNAIKYSPVDSRITISAHRNGEQALVSITDQGAGMDKEQLARVFDKFYRADASNTAVSGLGMGMSIVKHIIQAHDGTIDVASTPGSGTTVTFGLPLS